MATTIVRRIRALLASEVDDWFDDPDLLDYANYAKRSVVSAGIKLELDQPKRGGRSIRALNALRAKKEFTSLTFNSYRSYYYIDIQLPSSDPEWENALNVRGEINDSPIVISELPLNRLSEQDWGRAVPSAVQGFFQFYTDHSPDPSEKYMRIFLAANTAATKITLDYIKEPALLTDSSDDLIDLPKRLIEAVVLKGAINGGLMEGKQNTKDYYTMYQQQLNTHLW